MYQEKLRELNHSALTGIILGVALAVVIVISALSSCKDIFWTNAPVAPSTW